MGASRLRVKYFFIVLPTDVGMTHPNEEQKLTRQQKKKKNRSSNLVTVAVGVICEVMAGSVRLIIRGSDVGNYHP